MKLIVVIVFLVAPLQASEWRLGLSFPLYSYDASGGIGLWRAGDQWGFGMTLRGPAVDLAGGWTTGAGEGSLAATSLTLQRFRGKMFFFGELRGRLRTGRYNGGLFGMRVGAGIHRKYKDAGILIGHGIEFEGWDGNGVYEIVGLMPYPKVVVYWTL